MSLTVGSGMDSVRYTRPDGGYSPPPKDTPPPAADKAPPGGRVAVVDSKTGQTTDKYTVKEGDTVWDLVHNNPVPMTMDEFYALNPNKDKRLQDGKIPPNASAADPDLISEGDTIILKHIDAPAANTLDKLNKAQGADQQATTLGGVKGPDGKPLAQSGTPTDHQTRAWKDTGAAVDYELRQAWLAGGDKGLEERRNQMKGYAPNDARFQKLLNEGYDRVSKQTPEARKTDVEAYDVSGNIAYGKEHPDQLPKVNQELATDIPELNKAVDAEVDARIKTLGTGAAHMPDPYGSIADDIAGRYTDPEVQKYVRLRVLNKEVFANTDPLTQFDVLNKRLEGKDPEFIKAAYADGDIQKLINESVRTAYEKEGFAAGAKRVRELSEMLPPDIAAKVIKDAKPVIDKILTDLNKHGPEGRRGATPESVQKPFDQVATDLTIAANKISGTAEGKTFVEKELAPSIVAHLNDRGIRLFTSGLKHAKDEGQKSSVLIDSLVTELNSANRKKYAEALTVTTK